MSEYVLLDEYLPPLTRNCLVARIPTPSAYPFPALQANFPLNNNKIYELSCYILLAMIIYAILGNSRQIYEINFILRNCINGTMDDFR